MTKKRPVRIFDDETYPLECYEFYLKLQERFDDGMCEHCRKYLTVECPHIDEFLEEEEFEEEF